MNVSDLPALNAALNTIAASFLIAGFAFIRRGNVGAHRLSMIGALCASAAFLTSYVIYHANAGSRPFTGTGAIRVVYFVVLISHVVLATAIVPFVLVTVTRAFSGRFEAHRRIARITWPMWIYVSGTGGIVYLMLYRM